MDNLRRIDFIFDGRKFTAYFNGDGDIAHLYDWFLDRFLLENKETAERERPGAWVAAYSFLE